MIEQFKNCLSSLYIQLKFIDIVPTHLTIATCSKNLFTVLALLFCPAVCSLDMIHTFTSLSTSVATNKSFCIFLMKIQISQ